MSTHWSMDVCEALKIRMDGLGVKYRWILGGQSWEGGEYQKVSGVFQLGINIDNWYCEIYYSNWSFDVVFFVPAKDSFDEGDPNKVAKYYFAMENANKYEIVEIIVAYLTTPKGQTPDSPMTIWDEQEYVLIAQHFKLSGDILEQDRRLKAAKEEAELANKELVTLLTERNHNNNKLVDLGYVGRYDPVIWPARYTTGPRPEK